MITQPQMINGLLLASPLKRIIAFFIDFAFIYIILFAFINLNNGFRTLIAQHNRNMDDVSLLKQIMRINDIIKVTTFIVWILLGAIMDSTKIQGTLGKLIVQIKVVDSNGDKISLQKAIARNLYKTISSIFFLGFIFIAIDKKHQGFHDKMVKTFVVEKR
jgi:uncharacterized RDD family membrane protein YckC